jgi:phosphate/sulfate permease
MVDVGGIGETIGGIAGEIKETILNNPIASAIVGSAVVGGAIATGVVMAKRRKKKAKKKSKSSKKKGSKKGRKLKFGSKAYRKKYLKHRKHRRQRQPHTAGKRRDTSHKRIRYTKNNQPYVILSNGRARFIKRSSAVRSRKMKGGRY